MCPHVMRCVIKFNLSICYDLYLYQLFRQFKKKKKLALKKLGWCGGFEKGNVGGGVLFLFLVILYIYIYICYSILFVV